MDLATLAIFRAVANERGVTRAAEVLGRAPSNVTTRVQQLEAEVGVALFYRERKRMTLTPEGGTFLDYACRILELAEQAQQVLNPVGPTGVLRIGSMESTVATRLAPVLAAFNRHWPQVTIELSTAPTRQLLDALLDYTIDCAFVAIPSEKWLLEPEQVDTRLLFSEELVVVLPPGHPPIRAAHEIKPSALAAFAPGCTYRKLAEEWLQQGSSSPSRLQVQDVRSYHAMIACTAAGSCFSILPRNVLDLSPNANDFTLFPLTAVETHLASRSGFATPAFNAFCDLAATYRAA